MSAAETVVRWIFGLFLVWLSIPFLVALAAAVPFLYHWQQKAQKIFDFFADILYPWRWKNCCRRGKVPPQEADEEPSTTREGTNMMKQVTIYTDGACSGNPGPGGWGAILMYGPHKKDLSGGEGRTTNNRMELTGVIEAR